MPDHDDEHDNDNVHHIYDGRFDHVNVAPVDDDHFAVRVQPAAPTRLAGLHHYHIEPVIDIEHNDACIYLNDPCRDDCASDDPTAVFVFPAEHVSRLHVFDVHVADRDRPGQLDLPDDVVYLYRPSDWPADD